MAVAYEGRHGVANCDFIGGWAWDQNRPDAVITVDIFDGDALLATVAADVFREDLLDAGKGNGKHGFRHPVPDSLKDGRPHSIRVRISGTTIELPGSPRTLTCPPK
jgi:hypothetical protein